MIFKRYSRLFLKRHFRKSYCSQAASEWATCEPKVFSGIQPTGIPHLGNYVGAISNWLMLQNRYSGSMLLSIVDLHSITVPQQQQELRQNIINMTACLLGCGIHTSKTIIFQQSMVPYHTELAWILSCICTIPRIQKLAQWKEKQSKIKEPSVGLLTYPILQAADIMLYKSTLVPVGEDQTQHLELTRDLSRSFNRLHGVLFPECKILLGDVGRIKSLRNPTSKMSKSEPNDKSRIDLTDSPDVIKMKVKKAVTDFTSQISYDPDNRPGVSNLIDIHMALTDLSHDEVVEESFLQAEDTSLYKERLAEVIIEKLSPIRKEILRLQADKGYLLDVLRKGSEKASTIAENTIKDVRQYVGLR
ncbi:tryptophan--tRNA ligase mitochondrial-like isoform X1 [Biomphalaria pfeifferi]|uniref:Tryptophan--tRNA ligase, mitochondrial n=1 Tax=Biomphalaria pfeifferi TaxID=112525 RepID=A0AAD8BHG4_BIOPF|nr:tryptophan--tRNA ligase mitochondrial-like isoform X1 [Biomphalaria pfeifferi]